MINLAVAIPRETRGERVGRMQALQFKPGFNMIAMITEFFFFCSDHKETGLYGEWSEPRPALERAS